MAYKPYFVRAYEQGLIQNREEMILPVDAFPVLRNAFIKREKIRRKRGSQFLGRLRRFLDAVSLGNYTTVNGTDTINIFTLLSLAVTEPDAEIELASKTNIEIVFAAPISQTLTVTTNTNVLTVTGAGPIQSATINYATGDITIIANAVAGPAAVTFEGAYYPSLPVMGLPRKEIDAINNEDSIAFDTKYSYIWSTNQYEEFVPGSTWSGGNANFFWSTNWWVDQSNTKIFWTTNFDGITGQPIRYTNSGVGTTWQDFTPQINAAGDTLNQCLCILPFRSRLVTFNTLEGANLAGSVNYYQRIRWSAIGTPFTTVVTGIISSVNANAWRDDIIGQGGFLDIPTSQNIVSVGFVRDNLVIYCESSTWQLRYTGQSITPFQIEKVNTELGVESTFSSVAFDTSLVGIGDKGIVECDSYKSERIDIKIPDLVFSFNNENDGPARVHGIRDFYNRFAYWTYVEDSNQENPDLTFPNKRLLYNYENLSWAIFDDFFTCFGQFQPATSITWAQADFEWQEADIPWVNRPGRFPAVIAGNQQGYVQIIDQQVVNQQSLSIRSITSDGLTGTIIECINHNFSSGQIIQITNIPTGDFDYLNEQVFSIAYIDADSFYLYSYSTVTDNFSTLQIDPIGVYFGGGEIIVRDNFSIRSKKFNFLEEGQNIEFGYCDVLIDVDEDENSAFSMNVYSQYDDEQPINIKPQNIDPDTQQADLFFNSVIPTNPESGLYSTKLWKRIYCSTFSNFITLEYTFNNFQMSGNAQETEVGINAQVIWLRPAGDQLSGIFY